MNMLKYEQKHWDNGCLNVAGIDEAGRGPLAGPVVAACVIFNKKTILDEVKDSKKLSPKKRLFLYKKIYDNALSVGVGIVHENQIDKINILQATYLSMKKALGNMKLKPDYVLIDGPSSNIKQYDVEHIINGDNKSHSIAAASIVAKVTRDNIMCEYDKIFPIYNFKKNKGYGTKDHINQIKIFKSCPIHRKSFKIIKNHLPSYNIIEKTYGFYRLAIQCIAEKFIKQDYMIHEMNIATRDKDNFIELCLLKKNKYKFIKVKYIYKRNYNFIENKSIYLEAINKYYSEKDIKSDFDFVVISIEFLLKNKPIIKIIENY